MNKVLLLCLVLVPFGAGINAAIRTESAAPAPTEAGAALQPNPPVLRLFKDPKPVGDFSARTLDGRTLRAQDLRGKVVIVNFWATWCSPCRAEIPELVSLQKRYADHLQIVGISEDVESGDHVKRFAATMGVNYPVIMSTPKLQQVFAGVTGLPTSFIVDREGLIVQKHVGLLDPKVLEYETRALAGLDVSATVEHVDADRPISLENAAQAKEIPGVDLAGLSPDKRIAILQRLNTEPCTCGCGLSVAKCRIDDPACGVSLPIAQRIAKEIARRR